MDECRCKYCRKLLFKFKKGVLLNIEGSTYIEIQCTRCGKLNEIKLKIIAEALLIAQVRKSPKVLNLKFARNGQLEVFVLVVKVST